MPPCFDLIVRRHPRGVNASRRKESVVPARPDLLQIGSPGCAASRKQVAPQEEDNQRSRRLDREDPREGYDATVTPAHGETRRRTTRGIHRVPRWDAIRGASSKDDWHNRRAGKHASEFRREPRIRADPPDGACGQQASDLADEDGIECGHHYWHSQALAESLCLHDVESRGEDEVGIHGPRWQRASPPQLVSTGTAWKP